MSDLQDDFRAALDRLPSIDDLNEYIDAMQTVERMEDNLHEVLRRLPSIDELNELTEAMQTVARLADERKYD